MMGARTKMLEQIYPLLVVAVGFGVLGITGFGSALISVPLLAWVWPLHQVVPLVLLIDFVACLLLGGLQWQWVQVSMLWRFAGCIVGGVAVGAGLSQVPGVLDSGGLLIALGIYVAWVGWRGLRGSISRPGSWLSRPVAAGGLSGIIEVLWGTSGPLIVSHLATQHDDVRVLKAHTSLCLMLISGLACLTMGVSGRMSSPEVWGWLPGLMGVALVAMLLGHRWSQRAPVGQLRRIILMLLVASGLALAAQGLRRL